MLKKHISEWEFTHIVALEKVADPGTVSSHWYVYGDFPPATELTVMDTCCSLSTV